MYECHTDLSQLLTFLHLSTAIAILNIFTATFMFYSFYYIQFLFSIIICVSCFYWWQVQKTISLLIKPCITVHVTFFNICVR